jgi:hypothetical protein
MGTVRDEVWDKIKLGSKEKRSMGTTIRLSQESYDRLTRYKLANGLETMDQAVNYVLDLADDDPKLVVEQDNLQ